MRIMWLGQAGFMIENGNLRIAVDPYLSDEIFLRSKDTGFRRMAPSPLSAEELNADLVLISHDHADHYDTPTIQNIALHNHNSTFAGSYSACAHFLKDGFDPSIFRALRPEDSFSFNGACIRATHAKHSDPTAIGFIIKLSEKRIYFSADTLFYPELAPSVRKLAGGEIDACFICINGKLGNMNCEQAASLVKSLDPKIAIPMHYGLFESNTADPSDFIERVKSAGIKCRKPIYKWFEI